jgi:DNA (cytosine-5)-methyltransferase 1
MVLGSLFDGSGGFPLAGAINGITPVWASEIEPYPIRVTKARFPNMKHLGSVLDVKGDAIEPVDIITFGSPCQDLSVAGKQLGIHAGERSNLFFEAVRIAKEMRNHDRATGRSGVDVRPRFLVWENVPGAFSSNQGEDFRAVLEALGGIAEDGVSIPRPPKGKWNHAGCVVGDGWSIAWRVYDAQYWPRTPQRRKRIYLVADLASERAGEILFERESVCGHPAESGETREGIAHDAPGGAGGGCLAFKERAGKPGGGKGILINKDDHAFTLSTLIDQSICVASFKGGQGPKAGSIGYQEGQAPTLTSANSGTNTVPDVVYAAGFSDALGENAQGGMGYTEEGTPTLRAGDVRSVVYDCRGNGDGENVPTLTGDHQRRVSDYSAVTVYDTTQITSPLNYSNQKPGDPCHPLAAKQHPPLCVGNGQLHQMSMAEQSNTLDCMHDQQAVLMQGEHPRKYIVRRLTPLECCRLQGFPDWWEDGVEGSDSARYKMWGNGIALPCAVDVLRSIAKEAEG